MMNMETMVENVKVLGMYPSQMLMVSIGERQISCSTDVNFNVSLLTTFLWLECLLCSVVELNICLWFIECNNNYTHVGLTMQIEKHEL